MASIFDLPQFAPFQLDWAARCARYAKYRAYYSGCAYDKLSTYAAANKLYSGTRTLFSPLRRCTRVDVAKVPAAWALPESCSPITRDAVTAMRRRTNATDAYDRFVLYGATVGEAGLLLCGSPRHPSVLALRPDEVVTGTLDEGTPFALVVKPGIRGQGPRALGIRGQESGVRGQGTRGQGTRGQESGTRSQGPGALTNEYAQLITTEYVAEYLDGVEQTRQPNTFGFIPLVFAPYIEGEDGIGEPAFGGVLELLDRVNELASMTLDVIMRNVEPLIVGTGVYDVNLEPGQDMLIVRETDAKFYTLNPQIAIQETLAVIQDVRGEYKSLLPQLHLDELQSRSDLAYDTVMTLLSELGDHILVVRSSVDRAVETIERWMLDLTGGTPRDYGLFRERRWMALSESQQLALEAQRLSIAEQWRRLDEPFMLYSSPGATGRN
jgi:hypothetical protein